jgi:hypothetical protein
MNRCFTRAFALQVLDFQHSQPLHLNKILLHEFSLTRPCNHPTAAYDDFAQKVISALLVRLSVLPNTKRDCAKVFVTGLGPAGEIHIRVSAVSVETEGRTSESIRQAFLLAIHNVYHTLLAQEEAAAMPR